ncbi:hypothetical protein [Desulfosporosinus sp. BG]|uniref:hypothetical protein n=1 Tax=Desulfosporosinus sp. BG TaxID=1633135 RepID=UPI00083AC3D8|nr:hypothetical protein [Desulfosporosinus sp. BG]
MTQRSVPTTQSKLTVQAPAMGSGVPPKSAILGALAAAHVLVRCPVSGVGRFNGSLLFCLRRDVALVSHCVLRLGPGNGREKWEKREKGRFLSRMLDLNCETAHFMCAVWLGPRGLVCKLGTVLVLSLAY